MADAFKCDGCGDFHDGDPAVRMNTRASLPGTGTAGPLGVPDTDAQDVSEYCSQGCALEDNLGENARDVIEAAFESDPSDLMDDLRESIEGDGDDDG